MNNNKRSPLGLGITTVINMMVIISLIIFSSLTLFTAKNDYQFSKINFNSFKDFYEADAIGKEHLNNFLESDATEYNTTIEFGQNKELVIHLKKENNNVQILKWTVVVNDEVNIDTNLNLWSGD